MSLLMTQEAIFMLEMFVYMCETRHDLASVSYMILLKVLLSVEIQSNCLSMIWWDNLLPRNAVSPNGLRHKERHSDLS